MRTLLLRGLCSLALAICLTPAAQAQPAPPLLTMPVNDLAHVIDPQSAAQLDSMIRSLQQATGDVVVVATIDTFQPYGTINEYIVKMFENGGRGIGQRGKDNGVLVLLAVKDRRVQVEVGYDLEQFVTDGFAGQTSREDMRPEFAQGRYGPGLVAGVSRIIGRIAEGRNVTLQGVPTPQRRRVNRNTGFGGSWLLILFFIIFVLNAIAGRLRGGRRRGPWGGWSSGVGPFGGGFGGGGFGGGGFGGGGGGFGGGFGGFGGGRSGGGGGGAGW
jgi:uncharacterized protein